MDNLEAKYKISEKERQDVRIQSQREKVVLQNENQQLLNWLFWSRISYFPSHHYISCLYGEK